MVSPDVFSMFNTDGGMLQTVEVGSYHMRLLQLWHKGIEGEKNTVPYTEVGSIQNDNRTYGKER